MLLWRSGPAIPVTMDYLIAIPSRWKPFDIILIRSPHPSFLQPPVMQHFQQRYHYKHPVNMLTCTADVSTKALSGGFKVAAFVPSITPFFNALSNASVEPSLVIQ